MTVFDWLARSVSRMHSDGIQPGVRESADEFKHGLAARLDEYISGDSIFEYEWDLLIILDACRPDVLAEVSEDYSFLTDKPATIWSKGSGSRSWMERNFVPNWTSEMEKTAYVSGNPFTDNYAATEKFDYLDEVWRYAWDEDHGTIPARTITDRAIDTARTRDSHRLLVHYMQPHFPSIPDPIGSTIDIEEFGEGWESVWDDLASGKVSTERVWKSYQANLEYVLDDVELLLENVDAEIAIISADHGNAFGELGFYGHPPYNPIPSLRRVPWVETTATDSRTYEPDEDEERTDVSNTDVNARLRDLGYL
jgi:hypothetical protein